MGANAVIGVCHDATEVMQMTEVLYYGTAVRHAALIVPNLRQSLGAFLLNPARRYPRPTARHGCDARGAFAARVEPRGQRDAPDAVPSHGRRCAALRR
jgi:hypothetical protein